MKNSTKLKKNNLKNICGFWQEWMAVQLKQQTKVSKLMIWETQQQQKLRLERKWHSKPQMMKK